jgi:hypothetical protein
VVSFVEFMLSALVPAMQDAGTKRSSKSSVAYSDLKATAENGTVDE